jgi:hypothetical protein
LGKDQRLSHSLQEIVAAEEHSEIGRQEYGAKSLPGTDIRNDGKKAFEQSLVDQFKLRVGPACQIFRRWNLICFHVFGCRFYTPADLFALVRGR